MAAPKEHFVRGSFLLEKDITDTEAYYEQHKARIDSIIEWADENKLYVGFGVSEDHTYLCEYQTIRATKALCKGFADELKAMLKIEWKGVSLGYQEFGHLIPRRR